MFVSLLSPSRILNLKKQLSLSLSLSLLSHSVVLNLSPWGSCSRHPPQLPQHPLPPPWSFWCHRRRWTITLFPARLCLSHVLCLLSFSINNKWVNKRKNKEQRTGERLGKKDANKREREREREEKILWRKKKEIRRETDDREKKTKVREPEEKKTKKKRRNGVNGFKEEVKRCRSFQNKVNKKKKKSKRSEILF